MKVLFATLVVLVSLTLTKGNIIDIAMQMICKMNVEKPEKINELRDCMDSIFKEKSDLLPDAIRECDFAKFPYQKYEDYANEMCKEERYDDLQVVLGCVGEKFAAIQEDPEKSISETIEKCV